MEFEQKVLRAGAAAILCAVGLRLLSGGLPEKLLYFLTSPETAALVLYLETGRVVRPEALVPETTLPPEKSEPSSPPEETTLPAVTRPVLPVFSPEDAESVELVNVCGYPVDIPAMLLQELDWQLPGEAPTVLLLHTHGSECYSGDGKDFRSLDPEENVVSLGVELAALLENDGIRTVHDQALHDQPAYNDAYVNARQATKTCLAENPSICFVLDIHRDAAEGADGRQIAKTVTVDGEQVAQLMLVVGTDAGGLNHPAWEENMALAVKLQATLEELCPGICRPISFRTQRFNQDLSPGALILEIGTAGNTREEALRAVKILARAIETLAYGTG